MKKKNNQPIIISAPSGAGKSTLINHLLKNYQNQFYFSVSHTTRPIRKQEKNGIDYYFLSEKEFTKLKNNGDFLEWAKVGPYHYGSSISEVKKSQKIGKQLIFDIDIQGMMSLKERNIQGTYIFIAPPSMEILEDRLRKRNTETEEQLKIRLNRVKKEMKFQKYFDYVIINRDLSDFISKCEEIILN